MSELLVLVDHNEGSLRKISAQSLTAARGLADDLGADIAAVALGPGGSDTAEAAGRYGASRVYAWDSEDATGYVTLPMVAALQQVVAEAGAEILLFPSSNFITDVAARLAVRLEAGIITDATGIELLDGGLVVTKQVFGGAIITRSRIAEGRRALIGVKSNAFAAEESGGAPAEVVGVDVELDDAARASVVTERVAQTESGRPDIAEARIVVVGGRGLGDASGFELLGELADVLGAGLGASRAAADAGWIPHRDQIGQTGKSIAPQLYIGCGISGAIQHRVGMQTSQAIVAINKDPRAPIFEIADFGVVGDLYDVVPKLIAEIARRERA